ncbi:MAG: DUF1631 family protein [Rubrivivax sp.]|nr:DUF1631 family protein [Rubrivivax sp.]
MSTPDALLRFVDDELMRAPLLAEQMVEEALAAIGRDAAGMTSRERSLAADLQRALNLHRPLVTREFVRALTEYVQRELNQEESTRNAPPSGLGGLSLVDESQVEVDVEVSRSIEAIRSVAEYELRELMTYTSALVGDMDVARDYNPFRPEVLGRSLWDAAQALPMQRGYQLALVRHACMPLAQLMRKSYAGACARLESMGVEPAVYRTIIVFCSRRSQGQQDSFFDPGSNRAESTTPLPGAGGRPGSQAQTPPPAPAPAQTSAPRRSGPSPSIDQLLARTDEMLRSLPPDGSPHQREHLRKLQRQELVASADKPADRELIELIGRLFDAVLGDRRLGADMQTLLARLQMPALRLALRDPATLDNYTHPVWLLMDRIALQGDLHPPPGDPERTRMLRFMHGLLDTLAQEQARDSDAFRWARERVMAYERSRFEQRREAAEAELHSLQALEDQAVAGGPPPTSPGALDVGQLDTVPADLLDDLSAAGPGDHHPSDGAQWLRNRRSGEWVHMFMQGAWVNAQLLWYGAHREYWLFADGASANTWAIRHRAIERMLQLQLLTGLQPRSLIREAANRVLRKLGEA